MELILCRVVASSCLPTHKIAPHISSHDLPYHRTTKKYDNSGSMEVFQFSATISEHVFDNSPKDFVSSSLKWWSSMHGVDTL